MNERLKLKQGDTLNTKEKIYIIGEEIGKGANGIVYKVRGKRPAIKIFSPRDPITKGEMNNLYNRFKNEIIKLKELHHWNIIEIKDSGEYENNGRKIPFYIMEFADSNLRKLLSNRRLSLVKQFYF